MKKNAYINGLMAHHASLMSSVEHRQHRQWAFIVSYFLWDTETPFELAKLCITVAVNKRKQGV